MRCALAGPSPSSDERHARARGLGDGNERALATLARFPLGTIGPSGITRSGCSYASTQARDAAAQRDSRAWSAPLTSGSTTHRSGDSEHHPLDGWRVEVAPD